METLRLVIAGCFGLVVGSFLNVVIWRLPRGESVVTPRSRCPGCGKGIAWYDNIPVLSWLALRARCRGCGQPISARYPLVEALTGLLFVLAASRWPSHPATVIVVCGALAALVAISFIDWDIRIIPDRITKPGIVIAIALAPLTVLHPGDWISGVKPALNMWLHAAAGAAAGALVIYLIRMVAGWILRVPEAMGMGDVKLLGFIGALTGPLGMLYSLVLACLAGSAVGIVRFLLLWRRSRRLPLTVQAGKEETAFDRVLVRGEELEVTAATPAEEGRDVKVVMTLSEAAIHEDGGAVVELKGRVASSLEVSGGHRWSIELKDVSDEDAGRLDMIERAWRYVPFGPFLAIGGVVALLYGDWLHWAITTWYPEFARGLFGV